MKNCLLLVLSMTALSLNANAMGDFQLKCGNIQEGPAVLFQISSLERKISVDIYGSGKKLETRSFEPSSGIYDKAILEFSGNAFQDLIYIHGNYSRILRINQISAITISLRQSEGKFVLQYFSDGTATHSTEDLTVKERIHPEFSGLECATQ